MASKFQIVASPELIKLLGQKLYTYPLPVILMRELIQNAVDATAKGGMVEINTHVTEGMLNLSVADSGCGMDKHVLTDIFLSIGSSYKPETGSTGGFGIAKVALFSTDFWNVDTTDWHIDSDLNLKKRGTTLKGTVVQAQLPFDSSSYNVGNRMHLMVYANAAKNLVYNGEPVPAFKGTGRIHRHEVNGIDYTVRFAPALPSHNSMYGDVTGFVIYRINGLVQSIQYGGNDLRDAGKNMVVDFGSIGYRPTDDNYPFSLSRETPTWVVGDVVQGYLRELAKDVFSATDERGEEKYWVNPSTGLVSHTVDSKMHRPDLVERRMAKLWGRIISHCTTEEVYIGITNDESMGAFHTVYEGKHSFFLNAGLFLLGSMETVEEQDSLAFVMSMWHLAVHEVAHIRHQFHDEAFTCQESEIARKSILGVTGDLNDLRVLARKVWSK